VGKLNRLGRTTVHILGTVKALTDSGVTLVSTSDGIDSSTPAGRMMIGVLGSLAEYERELVRERTALKRRASRANGTMFGRPRKVKDRLWFWVAAGQITPPMTGDELDVVVSAVLQLRCRWSGVKR
jgi:DNA invertase Pin-like site-specific DNA recombinase